MIDAQGSRATRSAFPYFGCGFNDDPCQQFSGGTTVHLARVQHQISMVVSPTSVDSAGSVTATATVAPDTIGGMRLPWSAAWSWVPDSGASPTTVSCAISNASSAQLQPCTFAPNGSGTLWFKGVFNGQSDSLSQHVNVVKCPTGDPILDDSRFRQILKAEYDSSGADRLPYAQRREYAGAYYRDPSADTVVFVPFPKANSTPCTFLIPSPFPTSPPIPWLTAIPHAHPTDTVETVPPNVCPNAPDGGITRGGPSPADDSTAYNAGVPVFAVDKRYVYRTDGTRASHRQWARQSGTCTLL